MSSQVIPLVQSLVTAQVAVDKTIFDSAFAVYGVVDYVGTGGNVARLYNDNADTTERDFTASELVDGSTYSTWLNGASTASTKVVKLYNQRGDSDLDLYNTSAGASPNYESSENTVRFDQSGYFQFSNLINTTASTKIKAAFEDNTINSDTTIILGARKKDSSLYGLPASGRTLFAVRDTYTPSYAYNAKHKAMSIKAATYSDDIAVSVRDNDNEFVLKEHTLFDHSTLKTYIAEIRRVPAGSITTTDMNLFVNNTQEVDFSSTDIGNDIDSGNLLLGENRYIMKGAMLFNKILTSDEKSELQTRMSQDY